MIMTNRAAIVIPRCFGGGGVLEPKMLFTKNGPIRFSQWYISFFRTLVTVLVGGGGGAPPTVVSRSSASLLPAVVCRRGSKYWLTQTQSTRMVHLSKMQ